MFNLNKTKTIFKLKEKEDQEKVLKNREEKKKKRS